MYVTRKEIPIEPIEILVEAEFNRSQEEVKIKKCSMGDINITYVLEMLNEKYIIKMEKNVSLPILYSGQIERELAGLNLCKINGIVCPKVISYDLTGNIAGAKYIATEFLNAPLLSKVWPNMNFDEKMDMKQQALDMIKAFSNIRSTFFGDIYENGRIGQYQSWAEAFIRLIEIAVKDYEYYGSLEHQESDVILQSARECSKHLFLVERPCFCHMDFHWNNIFVNREDDVYKIAGIIDFGSSLFAPSYSDLFRLQGGFLYGTENFYHDIKQPYVINIDQNFSADLFNTLDYYVFLSFTRQGTEVVKKRMMKICYEYLQRYGI